MQNGNYRFFDGTMINLSAVVSISPIRWADDANSIGAIGGFCITEQGGRTHRIECAVSALVGPVRFMAAVRDKAAEANGECPARLAYRVLSFEAKRVLSIHHADLVSAWRSTTDTAMAA